MGVLLQEAAVAQRLDPGAPPTPIPPHVDVLCSLSPTFEMSKHNAADTAVSSFKMELVLISSYLLY